jgi:hypothetical protein
MSATGLLETSVTQFLDYQLCAVRRLAPQLIYFDQCRLTEPRRSYSRRMTLSQ